MEGRKGRGHRRAFLLARGDAASKIQATARMMLERRLPRPKRRFAVLGAESVGDRVQMVRRFCRAYGMWHVTLRDAVWTALGEKGLIGTKA